MDHLLQMKCVVRIAKSANAHLRSALCFCGAGVVRVGAISDMIPNLSWSLRRSNQQGKTPGLSEESDDVLSQRSIDSRKCCATLKAGGIAMNVQYAGNQFMSRRLVEVIQTLRDYLGPEAYGLTDEDVVHKVMYKALEYQAELSTLKSKEPPRPEPPHRYGQR